MNIYVATSWKNALQPTVVAALRAARHSVYDFRRPTKDDTGFHWSEIDGGYKNWSADHYRAALAHPIAARGFGNDMDALDAADLVVLVLPCGRSAHLELGWAIGAGKKSIVLLDDPITPELMYRMVGSLVTSIPEMLTAVGIYEAEMADQA